MRANDPDTLAIVYKRGVEAGRSARDRYIVGALIIGSLIGLGLGLAFGSILQ